MAVIAAAALAYIGIRLWLQAPVGAGVPSYDIYGAQWPMLRYFWHSLARGQGYLWNGLQNCGQPVVPMTPPGTLYPLNLMFLPFGLRLGFPAIAVVHLIIGGVGVSALCREYGAGRPAALCGALTFEFSSSALHLATWLPTANLGAYVWLPVALYLLERVIKHPMPLRALALAVVLALQLLAGSPQIALFTDQVIALRVLWAFAARQVAQPWRLLGSLGLAVALAFGLAAVQILPSLEFSRESLRSLELSVSEIQPGQLADWAGVRKTLFAFGQVRTLSFGSAALAIAALAGRATRGVAVFYWLLAILYVLLMFDTPIFALYLDLPFGRTFRRPIRFMWVVTFAISVLAGLGAQAILDADSRHGFGRYLPAGFLALGAVIYCLVMTVTPSAWEWACFAALMLAAVSALAMRPGSGAAPVIIPIALLAVILPGILNPFLGFQKDVGALTKRAAAFAAVRAMMTPQDRVYQYEKMPSLSIMPKSASLFDVRSITDYEPQAARRYAELWVYLARNAELTDSTSYNWSGNLPLANRPLMNLIATRYVLVGAEVRPFEQWMRPPYRLRWEGDGVRVFENPDALPRAYYAPRLAVVRDRRAMLRQLASDRHRPREVALVEDPPDDGYLGEATQPPALGDVVTLEDRGEAVRLDVAATGPGFVILTDQFFPGWQATVNGVPTPILRANYAFRAVRVPEGVSVVEFTYRPNILRLGAAVTLVSSTATILYAAWALAAARRTRATPVDPRGAD